MATIIRKQSKLLITITRHADVRMQQRGFSQQDIELITLCGTQVSGDGFVLTRKDVARETRQLSKRIKEKDRQLGLIRACRHRPDWRAAWCAAVEQKQQMAAQIQNLKRLENRKVVLSNGHVVTCYVCTRKELKRSLRLH